MKLRAALATGVLLCLAGSASAQVRYQPFSSADPSLAAPSPYGYPVPGGYVQPDETLGTSPSYVVSPDAYGGGPVVRIVRRCQYPDGWNVTDFSRDVNGVPAGVDHTCPVPASARVRARY